MKYLLILLIIPFYGHAQLSLDDGEEITFNIGSQFYALHKNDPNDVIQVFLGSCGLTECEVDDNTPFTIRYRVKNALNCWGTNGTSGWRVNLPIGTGTGDFTKTISGISSPTTFTLNCNGGNVLKRNQLVIFNQVNLTQILDQMGFGHYYSVIITLVGTEIKILPFNKYSEPKLLTAKEQFSSNTRFVFAIHSAPFETYEDFVKEIDIKLSDTPCMALGNAYSSTPLIQLSNDMDANACIKNRYEDIYLTYAVYETY